MTTPENPSSLPINDVTTFGDAAHEGGGLVFLDFLAEAPAADASRPRPAVKRVLSGHRANHIVFTFVPGQTLPDHKAAHPITVQVLTGSVLFECEGDTHELHPGVAVHLPAHLPHAVRLPKNSDHGQAIMLLTMHTGK